jgi:hypothetical protein
LIFSSNFFEIKKSIFKSVYKKIKNNLENKGIIVYNIKLAINEIHKYENNMKYKLTFDDTPYPSTNMLYIQLASGQYYNDSIYSNKKIDNEREMLILLAGKLGVKNITYESEITETTISKADVSVTAKGVKNGLHYNKESINKRNIEGKEEYLNRGAPVYLRSNNIMEVELNIKEKLGVMESNVFNYDSYKHNMKLESFVYKRFEFKMLKLEYTIDTEDISDISFFVKSCFNMFGINISFNKSVTYTTNIKYTLEFFTDKELKIEHFTTKKYHSDDFFSIREQYDSIEDKNLAVQYIYEYVTKIVKKCHYRVRDGCGIIYDFSKPLYNFIQNNPDGTFESICHNFRSTLQIKNWIYKNLSNNSFEIVNEEDNMVFCKKPNKFENNSEIHGNALSPIKAKRSSDINNYESEDPNLMRKNTLKKKRNIYELEEMQLSHKEHILESDESTPKTYGSESTPKTYGSESTPKTSSNESSPKTSGNDSSPKMSRSVSSPKMSRRESPSKTSGSDSTPKTYRSESHNDETQEYTQEYTSSKKQNNYETEELHNYDMSVDSIKSEDMTDISHSDEIPDYKNIMIEKFISLHLKTISIKNNIELQQKIIESIKQKNKSQKLILDNEQEKTNTCINQLSKQILHHEIKSKKILPILKSSTNITDLHTKLALCKAQHNDITNRIKELNNNMICAEKILLDLMNNYDIEIINKNELGDKLLEMGINIKNILNDNNVSIILSNISRAETAI